MTYPITVLMNKTVSDIETYARHLAAERNIPIDLLPIIFDSASVKIRTDAYNILNDITIDTLNKLDEAKNKEESIKDPEE